MLHLGRSSEVVSTKTFLLFMPLTSVIVALLNRCASLGGILSISFCDLGSGIARLTACIAVKTIASSSEIAQAIRSSSSLSNLV